MKERVIYRRSFESGENHVALRQGEILTGVIQYKPVVEELLQQTQELSFKPILHPYAIVTTQDCDLDWDYTARNSQEVESLKLLNSIILCEITTAQEIKDTRDINGKQVMDSKTWNLVKSHRHERYYFFEKVSSECEVEKEGLPELTADFKKVFGMDAATLYRQIEIGMVKRRTTLISPYSEHFSRRYHSFHDRVALPFQYESEKGC
ncbi:hypothetical protein [Chamaesiphon sp.]|uniref:hypothetical protein n=1 Tax=Chamaesiphon sp. TaxID=2814140 RepID=UPI003593BBB6